MTKYRTLPGLGSLSMLARLSEHAGATTSEAYEIYKTTYDPFKTPPPGRVVAVQVLRGLEANGYVRKKRDGPHNRWFITRSGHTLLNRSLKALGIEVRNA